MSVIASTRTSAKITDVLQVLYNPRTPEAAKQRTLRRLDGLEGRHAPIPKRRSVDHSERGDGRGRSGDDGDTALSRMTDAKAKANRNGASVGTDTAASLNCRFAITEGIAPLSSAETERRLSPPPSRPAPGGRRRVVFMDEWELAGQEQDTILQESLQINPKPERIPN